MEGWQPRCRLCVVIRPGRHHDLVACHHNHRNLNDNEFHVDDLDNVHHDHDNSHDSRTRNHNDKHRTRHDHDGPGDHHHLDSRALPRRDKHHPAKHNANNRQHRKHNLNVFIHDNSPC